MKKLKELREQVAQHVMMMGREQAKKHAQCIDMLIKNAEELNVRVYCYTNSYTNTVDVVGVDSYGFRLEWWENLYPEERKSYENAFFQQLGDLLGVSFDYRGEYYDERVRMIVRKDE